MFIHVYKYKVLCINLSLIIQFEYLHDGDEQGRPDIVQWDNILYWTHEYSIG